jgi:hypothetical protein
VPTPPSSPSPSLWRLQRRTIRILVGAQLRGALGLAAGGTAGALLAEDLTGAAAAPCLLVLAVVATTGGSRVGRLGGVQWSGSAPAGMSPAFRQRGSR